jgi:curli biogenesis system outer membrane secretion channel CsgG
MKKTFTNILSFLGLWILTATISFSGTSLVTIQTQGHGANRELAINAALKNAIMQVNGTEIKAITTQVSSKGGIDIKEGKRKKSIKFEFENSTNAQLKSEGLIDSYEVLDVMSSGSEWKAKVLARVAKYELEKSSERKKVALFPVENRAQKGKAGRKLALELQNAIEGHIVQTRKFAVLSRGDIDKVLNEQNFIGSDGIHKSEKAKLGNLLGGDVVLIVTIDKAYYRVTKKYSEIYATPRTIVSGELTINMKVISSVTGEIKFSNTFTSSINRKNRNMTDMVNEVALSSVKDLVKRIYPAMVIKVSKGNVYLNTGGKAVKKGDIFTLYDQGEELVDPYTGEMIGAVEEAIGKIKISKVRPKFSIAKVIEGEGIQKGMIARPSEITKASKPKKHHKRANTSGIKTKNGGGVILPFD